MKVKYWWKESESLRDGIMRPKCDCAEVLDDFKGLVFSFLNDDEGLGLKYLSKWIDDGLIEIEKIKVGELNYYDMLKQKSKLFFIGFVISFHFIPRKDGAQKSSNFRI